MVERDNELDALKVDITRLRDDVAALAASLRERGHGDTSGAAEGDERPGESDEGSGIWSELLSALGTSRVRGEKIIKEVAAEVGRHPVVSLIAAFGIGFIVATLWHRGSRQ